jgi:hypothetical protein
LIIFQSGVQEENISLKAELRKLQDELQQSHRNFEELKAGKKQKSRRR